MRLNEASVGRKVTETDPHNLWFHQAPCQADTSTAELVRPAVL
jgi:hypothetical protein